VKAEPHICQRAEDTLQDQRVPRLPAKLRRAIHHAWQILRDVLRGYCAGQSPDDPRPRKGCC